MKTAFQNGPAMFAIRTIKSNPKTVRVYCCRLEAYDLGPEDDTDECSFQVLFAQAEENKEIAKALLDLKKAIECNEKFLTQTANS